MSNRHHQKGTSLIEILVTILIVSFGLLGVAGVVGNGLKGAHGSQARSQATTLAADIIDRMRANRTDAESDPGGAGSPYNLALADATPAQTIPPKVALQDLIDWRTALAATLPEGTGSVDVDSATKKVIVTVQWKDSRVTGRGTGPNADITTDRTFVVETRL